jgi:hypothetical protein
MEGALMNRREEKRAHRKQRKRSKQRKLRSCNQELERCGICGKCTQRVAAQAMYIGDDGSFVPYIVCPRCVKKDLTGENANTELAALKTEFNLGITRPTGGLQ